MGQSIALFSAGMLVAEEPFISARREAHNDDDDASHRNTLDPKLWAFPTLRPRNYT